MKTNVLLMLLLAAFVQPVAAQVKKTPGLKAKLYGVGRPGKEEIMLRWALDNEQVWMLGNQYGFIVERYTIVRDGKTLDRFEKSMQPLTIKPKPLAQWDSIANHDDYAAVIAQAIYGEDFEVSVSDNDKIANIVNKTEAKKQRYNMAMYAADHSFSAAVFGGIAWKDSDVKKGEKYLYRIISKIPKDLCRLDTALVYVGLEDYQPLPKPSGILAEFGDKTVLLKWDFESYAQYYTSYQLERSDDGGKTFNPLTDKPVTALTEKDPNNASGSVFYLDSLGTNEIEYQYRVAGISLFGEASPYSDVTGGKGKTMLALTPGIMGVEQDKENAGPYSLNWEFEDSLSTLLKEFRVNQSVHANGPYTVYRQGIMPQERAAKLNEESGYFTVTAVAKDGSERTSLPYLLQREDSIPPAVPSGLAASIDSSGIVTVTWQPNAEKDLAGYQVFRADNKGNEPVLLTDSLWQQASFTDTLNLKTLNRKVYYTVVSVDTRYNQSLFASLAEVVKPDIIPPTKPVLSGYEVTASAINIEWINSSDEDVAFHKIYKKEGRDNSSPWQLLSTVSDKKITRFTDTSCVAGATYSYTVLAMDSANLESGPAQPLTVYVPEQRVKTAVKKLEIEVDRQNRMIMIEWAKADNVKDIRHFQLYRGEDKVPMSLYKQFSPDTLSFTDTQLRVNTKYKYAVRAVFKNGGYSDFSTQNIIY